MLNARTCLSVAIGLGFVACAVMFGQDAPARGRGQRPPAEPNPLGQPLLDPAGHVKEDAFFHAPLAPADAKYGDIQGDHLKAVLNDFIAISEQNRAAGE